MTAAAILTAATQAGEAAPEEWTEEWTEEWIVWLHAGANPDALLDHVADESVVRTHSLLPAVVVNLDPSEAAALAKLPQVRSVEPNARLEIAGSAPSLPLISSQLVPWGISAVHAPETWNASNRGAGVRVAVLDTGMRLDHPDLPAPVATESFVAGETVDDGNGHGTHVAGIIAALDNSIGVVGVAPEVDLLIGKVLSNAGSGSYSGIIAGIEWALLQGADVISLAFGGSSPNAALEAAVDAAWAAGVLVVSAAGNSGSNAASYPAAFASAISVTAVDDLDNLASFSNYHSTVDLTAPGVRITSTVNEDSPIPSAEWAGLAREAGWISGASEGIVSAAVYDCGLATGSPGESCPFGVSGNIAHIRRGSISFTDKVAHAAAAGAVGVVFSNNGPGLFSAAVDPTPLVAVTVSQADGDDLAAQGDGTAATVQVAAAPYAAFSSTTMASAHVTAALALLVSCAEEGVTATAIRNALESTSSDLGPAGWDQKFGHGLIDVHAALAAVPGCPLLADAGVDRVGGMAVPAFVGAPLGGSPAVRGGRGPYSILWSSTPTTGHTLSDPAAANPVFTGISAGSYTWTLNVTDAGGSVAGDDVSVEVVCPTHLELSGQVLTGDIATYEAIETITAVDTTVEAGADVTFRVGQSAVLANGFVVSSTASFAVVLDSEADCVP